MPPRRGGLSSGRMTPSSRWPAASLPPCIDARSSGPRREGVDLLPYRRSPRGRDRSRRFTLMRVLGLVKIVLVRTITRHPDLPCRRRWRLRSGTAPDCGNRRDPKRDGRRNPNHGSRHREPPCGRNHDDVKDGRKRSQCPRRALSGQPRATEASAALLAPARRRAGQGLVPRVAVGEARRQGRRRHDRDRLAPPDGIAPVATRRDQPIGGDGAGLGVAANYGSA